MSQLPENEQAPAYRTSANRRLASICDGYDWRDGTPRACALRLGHKGSCSGDPCEHPIYMDGRCYDCGAPHPADCDCGMRPPVDASSLPEDRSRDV